MPPKSVDMEPISLDAATTLTEFAGRACYQSFHRPNEKTRHPSLYVANIIKQGHESVLEHASVTYYITGVSRSLTHELVRHRHFSYSQLSQRFVDEDLSIILPPATEPGTPESEVVIDHALDSFNGYRKLVKTLEADGLGRKQAREAARSVLPNCIETKIVVTGNHRAWREFIRKRIAPGADAEIQRLARMILRDMFKNNYPLYQDFDASLVREPNE